MKHPQAILPFFFLLLASLNLTGCGAAKSTTMWVRGETVECDAGVGMMQCMLVYEGEELDAAKWEFMYDGIEGFDFREGKLQKIQVKKEHLPENEVPADGSSIRYTLVKVLEEREDFFSLLEKEWTVVAVQGVPLQSKVVAPSMKLEIGQMKVSGSDGCNSYFGEIAELSADKIRFSGVGMTEMFCVDMELVDNFAMMLDQVAGYSVDGGELTLMDAGGKPLMTLGQAGMNEPAAQLHDIWVAIEIDGIPVGEEDPRPRLEINLEEHQVMGNDGCNNYSGAITDIGARRMALGPLRATKKACPDMRVTDAYNRMLPQVAAYRLRPMRLFLLDAKGREILVFDKTD